jgi:hypothetical protein
VAALATVKASLAEKAELLKLRREFYKTALDQARKSPIKGYIFGDNHDITRNNAFVNLLLKHDIDCYEVDGMTLENKKFEKGKAYYVPTEQLNYIMVRSVFEKQITYSDSVFYDASTWSLVHAFNLPYLEVKTPLNKGKKITEPLSKTAQAVEKSDYAYLIEAMDYNIHKAIYALHTEGVICQAAFKPFSVNIKGNDKSFGYGTIVIPVQQQRISNDVLFEKLKKISQNALVDIYSTATGYSSKGIDLGSGNIRTLKKPEALMVIGQGVNGYEAGEVWHLLDQRIGMPITKVEAANLPRLNLNRYNTIVMVGGTYTFDRVFNEKIKAWVQSGNTLITLKTASEWLIKQGIIKEQLVSADSTKKKIRYNYDDANLFEDAKGIGGSIFEIDLDNTHPIGFGFTNRKVSVYRNGATYLRPSEKPYNTVGQYTASPLIGGYMHAESSKRVANSAAILVNEEGGGRYILFSDNPNFRGAWYGTNKLFLNALFFGSVITPQSTEGGEEEDKH